MTDNNYMTVFTVDASPNEVFDRINQVTRWWTENLEGSSQNLNDEFTVRFDDVHMSKQKLAELIPNQKVVWLVTDSELNFIKDRQEWTGTKIIFDMEKKGDKTQVRFTHQGLKPAVECFDACSNAWTEYIQQSLRDLIQIGKGRPTRKQKSKN